MTATTTTPTPAATPAVGTWTLTWHGVRTVAALELRQRVRSSRWKAALVVWFVVVGAITLLAGGVLSLFDAQAARSDDGGVVLFVAVTALVLGLGLLVTPTLTSTAVNGDRAAGTLATLQVTLLSPAEIAAGKLLAAWLSACAFLVVSLPFFLIALAMGGVPVATLPRVVVLTALLLAAVCGMGLGWSTLAARPAGSTVLTFLTVAALTVFTPIFFGLTYPFLSTTQEVRVYGVSDDYWVQQDEGTRSSTVEPTCELTVQERDVARTEWTWWLLAINPFAVVGDGAVPAAALEGTDSTVQTLRDLRLGAPEVLDECWAEEDTSHAVPPGAHGGPVWPFGLAVNLLLGAAGFVTAVRRLRIPQRTLARGTRVA
ncbi:ABC transporter permease subunit [Cellulomonas sp. zg-ZUI199]|uniref:ABC transporter permease subunit n=1 Tax=Cellulomonas wangleii TaxID=2816956 RepID=A0ABX8D3I9_9CELL|nr:MULTISPECIES: ABC transporter permease subunit [Cellulomonas]MBO0899108.1 ABC transporter permease subunit [Cellulomonas sp. zg-ZUI22]MBO0923610.1 ABC transporter permease subunit [Cellulomonas wangleii]QVI61934.1 ABC transporter permease subunit [Cellulomonas wangleii]